MTATGMVPAGYGNDDKFNDVLSMAGGVVAIVGGIGTLVAGATALIAFGAWLAIALGVLYIAYIACKMLRGGKCFDDPPANKSTCKVATNGSNTGLTGMGGVPPAGGHGCGNVRGAKKKKKKLDLQVNDVDSFDSGRFTVKIWPKSSTGVPLTPFTGATDPGGYFDIPLIPQGEPFIAVAIDSVTGAERTFEGIGPATGDAVYIDFEFPPDDTVENNYPIRIGDTVSNGKPSAGAGNIEVPGGQDIYTFNATAGQGVYLDDLSTECKNTRRWQLLDATGEQIFDEYMHCVDDDLGPFALVHGGRYTLTVYGFPDGRGTYSFKILNAPQQHFHIAVGETVSGGKPAAGAGNIDVPWSRDIYTFSATAGVMVYFDSLTGDCSSRLGWNVVDSTGASLFISRLGGKTGSCGGDPGTYTLTKGGTLHAHGLRW